jgi:phage gp36-like protein
MAYCTQTDMLESISEDDLIDITDDDDAGIIDTDAVDRAIADADAEINTYCAVQYDVPFATVPAMVRKIAVDIAVYNLYSRRRGAPDDRKERYNNAIALLKSVAAGTVSLGVDTPSPDDDGGPAAVNPKSDRIFTLGRASDSSSGSLDNY